VIGIFTGHFHEANRALYGSTSATRELAISKCVADKTWVAPPLALKNQADKTAPARGFLLATATPTAVTRAQVFWFKDVSGQGAVVAPGWKAWPWLAAIMLLVAIFCLAWLAWTGSSRSAGYRDLNALIVAVLFLELALGAIWLARNELGLTDSAILIALLILPLLLYGVASGRLTEFSGPGGWGAKFREAAQQPVDLSLTPVDLNNTDVDTIRKSTHRELQDWLRQGRIREGRPLIMTMTLGQGTYAIEALRRYLHDLSQFPTFKFVVVVDAQGRLVGYVPPRTLKRALEFSPAAIESLIAAINTRDEAAVREFPGMLTERISRRTTNAEALEEMEKLGVDALVVVDEATARVIAVVDRDHILSRMISALAKGPR
jgi:hypothetical protein